MTSHTERDESSTVRTVPGRSARKEAERRRERAAELLRSADRWERGAQAEERTAATLAWLPPLYVTLHDLRLPGSPSNVDHLVVGPTGVFLLDTKVHDGTVRYGSGTLWRGRFPMRREFEALALEAARLGAVLDAPVVTAMCFAEGDLPRRHLSVDGVRVLTPGELLPFIADRAATVLPHEVERLVQEATRVVRRGQSGAAVAPVAAEGARTPAPPVAPTVTAAPIAAVASTRPRPLLLPRALRLGAALALAGAAAFVTGTLLHDDSSPAPGLGGAVAVTRPTGAATSAPAMRASAQCPRPGNGWALELDWPGLPAGATHYEVAWRRGGAATWVTAGSWSSPDQLAPLVLDNLPPGSQIEIRLVAQDAAGAAVGEWLTTSGIPSTAC